MTQGFKAQHFKGLGVLPALTTHWPGSDKLSASHWYLKFEMSVALTQNFGNLWLLFFSNWSQDIVWQWPNRHKLDPPLAYPRKSPTERCDGVISTSNQVAAQASSSNEFAQDNVLRGRGGGRTFEDFMIIWSKNKEQLPSWCCCSGSLLLHCAWPWSSSGEVPPDAFSNAATTKPIISQLCQHLRKTRKSKRELQPQPCNQVALELVVPWAREWQNKLLDCLGKLIDHSHGFNDQLQGWGCNLFGVAHLGNLYGVWRSWCSKPRFVMWNSETSNYSSSACAVVLPWPFASPGRAKWLGPPETQYKAKQHLEVEDALYIPKKWNKNGNGACKFVETFYTHCIIFIFKSNAGPQFVWNRGLDLSKLWTVAVWCSPFGRQTTSSGPPGAVSFSAWVWKAWPKRKLRPLDALRPNRASLGGPQSCLKLPQTKNDVHRFCAIQ